MNYITSDLQFIYKNKKFNYCINSHNTRGSLTERVVEIPLLQWFLQVVNNPIEIGCVSPYYWETSHEIYDLTDSHKSCKNINAKDIEINNRDIVSISTIEHFDVENYNINNNEYIDSVEYLKRITERANQYLVTFALGYNNKLTDFVLHQLDLNINFIARQQDNTWTEVKKESLTKDQLSYNKHIWYGNSIAVIENIL